MGTARGPPTERTPYKKLELRRKRKTDNLREKRERDQGRGTRNRFLEKPPKPEKISGSTIADGGASYPFVELKSRLHRPRHCVPGVLLNGQRVTPRSLTPRTGPPGPGRPTQFFAPSWLGRTHYSKVRLGKFSLPVQIVDCVEDMSVLARDVLTTPYIRQLEKTYADKSVHYPSGTHGWAGRVYSKSFNEVEGAPNGSENVKRNPATAAESTARARTAWNLLPRRHSKEILLGPVSVLVGGDWENDGNVWHYDYPDLAVRDVATRTNGVTAGVFIIGVAGPSDASVPMPKREPVGLVIHHDGQTCEVRLGPNQGLLMRGDVAHRGLNYRSTCPRAHFFIDHKNVPTNHMDKYFPVEDR